MSSDETSWQQAVSAIEREHGRLDILVNNAGIGDVEPLEQTSLETYARVVAITQTSVFLGMKATAELLKQSGAGAVVNVSSIFGIVGGFGVSPGYAAAKGAVRTLTKNVALLWATQGVRVNSIHPGFIDTPILGDTDRDTLVEVTPMGRLGTPAEVAEAIAFLASPGRLVHHRRRAVGRRRIPGSLTSCESNDDVDMPSGGRWAGASGR